MGSSSIHKQNSTGLPSAVPANSKVLLSTPTEHSLNLIPGLDAFPPAVTRIPALLPACLNSRAWPRKRAAPPSISSTARRQSCFHNRFSCYYSGETHNFFSCHTTSGTVTGQGERPVVLPRLNSESDWLSKRSSEKTRATHTVLVADILREGKQPEAPGNTPCRTGGCSCLKRHRRSKEKRGKRCWPSK